VRFSLEAPTGGADGGTTLVAVANAPRTHPLGPGESITASAALDVASPRLWSSALPYLYTVRADVQACSSAAALDSVNVSHGFRTLRYDADRGFFLNQQHFKVRGFCDHNDFAVVGMAVPARINLFRAMALRAIGGNGRRTSHNPPDTSILEIYDRVGVVVMDENRLFANRTDDVHNMGALVRRDRNHPAVVIWSFCNEAGCEGSHENGGPRFREITYRYDGSRPTLANMFTFGDLLSDTIDVQGFSHQTRDKLDRCHQELPHKPIYMSECCSCNTMRDEDEGCETTHDNPHNACLQKSFNARCAESNSATNASDGVAYAVGTMVWTLFDYFGEPPVGGLEVSSTYGQFDLAGFPKAAAFWYRAQWLLSIPDGPDKPFPTNGSYEVHLVESWESPDAFPSTRGQPNRSSIHAYSNAPSVDLRVNGKTRGSRSVRPMVEGPGSYAEWLQVPWEAGTLTAVAHDANGRAVATATRHTTGAPSALQLTIDAPSAATGTGSSLVLDGQDAALLRASIVDQAGRVVHNARHNVTFRVVSGPGAVQGAHNGDAHCHEPNNVPYHTAYHGLVRAVVRVTSTEALPVYERTLLARIDVEGPMATPPGGGGAELALVPILIEATTPGLPAVRVSIPVSTDAAADGVMAVAASMAGKPVPFGFGQAQD